MPVKQYPLFLLTGTLFIGLTSQPIAAFTIVHTPRIQDYVAISNFPDGGTGITTLDVFDPKTVTLTPFNLSISQQFIHEIKRGGTNGLLNDLQLYKNEGWTFNKGRNLRGSFNVRRLYACGIGTPCGTARIGGANGISEIGIGATLELEYRPSKNLKSGDPTPSQNRLQWIQRVITNYPPELPGINQSYIDNRNRRGENAPHPYYGGGVNPKPIQPERGSGYGYFGDRPYRIDNFNRDYYWIAELYLAEADKSNPLNVTIYNGVRWGWRYQYIPNNDSCLAKSSKCSPPPPPVCTGGSGGGGCDKNTATDYVNYQDEISPFDLDNMNELEYNYLSFLDFDEIDWNSDEEDYWYDDNEYADWNEDNSESPTSVPESTSTFGLLLLSAFVFIKSLTITKD